MKQKKLSLSVKKAIRLLRRDGKDKDIYMGKDWGEHTCPIACVYGLPANPYWKNIFFKKELKAKGWDKRTYQSFIKWHDKTDVINGTEVYANRDRVLVMLGGK